MLLYQTVRLKKELMIDMKKITALVLSLVMIFALAGCGEKAPAEEAAGINIENPADILNAVWENWGEDKQFPAMGGDMDNMVENGAGSFDLANTDLVLSSLHISEQTAKMSDAAASLIHAMNANTFTGAAFHLAEGTDAEAFAAAVKDEVLATQWMCGFPETLLVYTLGDYVVYALGEGGIVENFKLAMSDIYGENAVIAFDEAV